MSTDDYLKIIEKRNEETQSLINNLKFNLPKLEKLYEEISGHWTYEDLIYRFYHGSYKVYYLQDYTIAIIDSLKNLMPEKEINEYYKVIFDEGTGKKFKSIHNKNWLKHTRPICEAFFHAKYFLEMAIKYGKELDECPEVLPSGWAGLLYFWNMR